MAPRTSGDRFRLLVYREAIGRYRLPAFLLTMMLLGLWYALGRFPLAWPPVEAAPWLMAGGLASAVLFLFALLGPRFAYVQARRDHLRVQTPIYRMKVSYRRIHNTRPVDVARMFPRASVRGSDRAVLSRLYGKTALGVDLRGLPLSRLVLRLFFHRLLFAADTEGLVLVVDKWMTLSNQLSSLMDAWRTAQQARPRSPSVSASAILNGEE
ncbi:MAG: hypothetical protein A2Y93_13080 [Chloroflexi bacterium RBG_13_68_17]|jgi:hypothetical protein|nr:MAG: hypothetical protein A2Y93_13080 [Chloroflexi bacterium RBG_13_68_17]